jgi:hypothetical protein
MSRGPSAAALAVVLAAAALAGCASPVPTSDVDAPVPVLRTARATTPVDADDLAPMGEAEWTFERRDAAGATVGAPVAHVSRSTSEHDADRAFARGGTITEYWIVNDDGAVAMPVVVEHPRRALTRFDPPLLVAPARLERATPVVSEVSMRVLDARNTSRQRESGTATRTIEYVADQVLDTPLGELRTKRVEVTFVADLRLADVEKHSVLWVAPGMGIVAQVHEEVVHVMGVAGTPVREVLVRVE